MVFPEFTPRKKESRAMRSLKETLSYLSEFDRQLLLSLITEELNRPRRKRPKNGRRR